MCLLGKYLNHSLVSSGGIRALRFIWGFRLNRSCPSSFAFLFCLGGRLRHFWFSRAKWVLVESLYHFLVWVSPFLSNYNILITIVHATCAFPADTQPPCWRRAPFSRRLSVEDKNERFQRIIVFVKKHVVFWFAY